MYVNIFNLFKVGEFKKILVYHIYVHVSREGGPPLI